MKIVRDDIPIETVYGEMGDDKIAHVQITSFSEQTYEELVTILAQEPATKASKYAIRPEAIHTTSKLDSYAFEATAKQSIMSGNIIKTVFEKNNQLFTIEQLHRDAVEFVENKTYALYVEKENVMPLTE